MVTAFENPTQKQIFDRVISGFSRLGYGNDLIAKDYLFQDWFVSNTPSRIVPAVAFGQEPFAYNNACLSVLISNGKSGENLVNDYRALGAPIAFEVGKDKLTVWKVGKDKEGTKKRIEVQPNKVTNLFQVHSEDWAPETLLRTRNVIFELGPKQLDFFDLGLIPALELCIREKLDRVLKEIIKDAYSVYRDSKGSEPDVKEIFRLIFRLLAAKVLHDRGVNGFRRFSVDTIPKAILDKVAQFYERAQQPIIKDLETQKVIVSGLWSGVSFQNLSVETLAYIYENTLVDDESRKSLGIHSTPYSIARYIVRHLPIHELPPDRRKIVEPCSGHGIFLVAALQRLRELLPRDITPQERHRYFVKMLHGYENDSFALEVSKLCLMLADFPNHNGWKLHNADIFVSKEFSTDLKNAGVVLCNPPYEDFTKNERNIYSNLRSVHKPVELLSRVLKNTSLNCMLGFVLPRQFLDGNAYKSIREQLAKRYEEIDVVALPDRIFHLSQIETSLLIAKKPRQDTQTTKISFVKINDNTRQRFLDEYVYSWKSVSTDEINISAKSFAIPYLKEVWEKLRFLPQISQYTVIHRGLEWKNFSEENCYSKTAKKGFRKGYARVNGALYIYSRPKPIFLNCRRDMVDSVNRLAYPWGKQNIFINSNRISRGPWRHAAFIDFEGNICSKNFHAIWVKDNNVSLEYVAAVLNGPVANAFVSTRERGWYNTINTIKQIPFPQLSASEQYTIKELVNIYLKIFHEENSKALPNYSELKHVLLKIDSIVLKGYALSPRLERELLDYFSGHNRPVSFDFKEYLPQTFTPNIPLWMYLSSEFKKCNTSHFLESIPKIKDPLLIEALDEVGGI